MFRSAPFLVPFVACLAAPLAAEVPEPLRAMVEAAIETGDAKKVDTVVDLAIATHPDAAEELRAIRRQFRDEQKAIAAAAAAREQEAIRNADIFERWSGEGEIGAFRSTGNNDNLGLTGAIELTRQGIEWSHKIRANADYQRSNGRTTRERLFAAYEPRYDVNERLFTYGLLQFERDRFRGYDQRYSASGGFGYHVVDTSNLDLSVQAGPAFRRTDYASAGTESSIAALLGIAFDWRITDRLTLTQDTNAVAGAGGQAVAFIDGAGTTLNLITGLEAKVSDRLSTRFAYTVDYASNPPPGAVSTDTLSRFTLVYDF